MNNTNFIIHEPADEYHARSRSGEFMSSHLLADFRESPALYRRKVSGKSRKVNLPHSSWDVRRTA
ncbi:MAG: hypothetical protein L6W00_00540 [Lentisphaeria bacterium]|nr:MAG: hypothetical protein L6W00_00540 [Lentisphaeria bacterium]